MFCLEQRFFLVVRKCISHSRHTKAAITQGDVSELKNNSNNFKF